ncbi:hypothetical protein OFB61_23985, partial [Escherichia coli]|nr:hypothetical protein [Escherichia coli]
LNSNILAIIRKGAERLWGCIAKGTYTIGNLFTNVISYVFKLYKDSIIKRKIMPNFEAFDIPDIYLLR